MSREAAAPTVGDALSVLHKRLSAIESKDSEAQSRHEVADDVLKHANESFGLTGDKALTEDTEGLDYSDPIKFNKSVMKLAATRVKPAAVVATRDDEDDEDEDDEMGDEPITDRRLVKALSRVMGGGTSASGRPVSGHRSVTEDEIEAASEAAGGPLGMSASIVRMKTLVARAESDPKTQKFLAEQVRAGGRRR